MNVEFESLEYKNFLSVGNNPIKINLRRPVVTLIVGRNGHGKSSLIDAFYFAITGKPFRDINKPQLVNTRNNKDCLVTLVFKIGSNRYKIERGIKPTIFRVYKNGELVEQEGRSLDYQEYLSRQVLRFDEKSIRQVVILGNANYVPFMKLDAAARRKIIEELLDIDIFSKMRDVLKAKMDTTKETARQLDYDVALAQERIKMQEGLIVSEKTRSADHLASLQAQKDDYLKQLLDASNHQTILDRALIEANKVVKKNASIQAKINTMIPLRAKVAGKIERLEETIAFFDQNPTCPTCSQSIDDDHCASTKAKAEEQIVATRASLDEMNKIIQAQTAKIDLNAITRANDASNAVAEGKMRLAHIRGQINSLDDDIDRATRATTGEAESALVDLHRHLEDKIQERGKVLQEKEYQEASAVLLKDGGIKTKIIQRFIPEMNKAINKYLAIFGLNVNFTLDEKFNEKILSPYRQTYSYGSFSEGEKARIDISIMLAWRDLAKARNSLNTNILILDEVFNQSLEEEALEELIGILKGIEKEVSIMVITHLKSLHSKFEDTIKFEKVADFTRISQEAY